MTAHRVFSRAEAADRRDAPPALPCPAQELVIRRLKAADMAAVEAHLLALDPAGRASRFHVPLCDDAVRAYARRLDCRRMILVGAVDPETGEVIGLAEAHLGAGDGPQSAEVSVSVLTRHRGRGIGRLLVAVALDAAAARGARRAEFHYQAGNRAIAHLVRDLGAPAAAAPGFAALALPLGPAVLH